MTSTDQLVKLDCSKLTDEQLLTNLKLIAQRGRIDLVRLLKHLVEVHRRSLVLHSGFPSLFEYCVQELKFSRGSAFRRMEAVKLVGRFPIIYRMLADGDANLTTLTVLADHLTEQNHEGLLLAACGKGRVELERMVAQLGLTDRKESREQIRYVAPKKAAVVEELPLLAGTVQTKAPVATPVTALVEPRSQLKFCVSDAVRKKLERMKSLMFHIEPNTRIETMFEAGIDAWLDRHDPVRRYHRRKAKAGKGRTAKEASSSTRRVPEAVKGEVWVRDGGRCAFVGRDGRACGERVGLEVDHVRPWALGGASTEGNTRLLCRGHNQAEARKVFGAAAEHRQQ